MEIKKECVQFLGEYYKELFFGNVNKRYRAMTGAELKKRLRRLTEENLKPIEKANELSDIHAMLSKSVPVSCARRGTCLRDRRWRNGKRTALHGGVLRGAGKKGSGISVRPVTGGTGAWPEPAQFLRYLKRCRLPRR